MIKLDEKKLAKLKTGSQHFDEKYGPENSPSRIEFEAKAKAWYYAELLRDERKRQKLTQQQLGERIGRKQCHLYGRPGYRRRQRHHWRGSCSCVPLRLRTAKSVG